ncbi:hypothetical protein [Mesorhizobium sp. CA16]|uniref:hypothetical protein n=1 Tax=Mesorhizobium sp. CA16 TaxID=588496 RepID=UPI001CCF3CDE|nr:hypothetical protein [Mesorhizobium sp. CA16]MBZ9914011.1 hypothetical protein [Mesorhizobium sp. CA16]
MTVAVGDIVLLGSGLKYCVLGFVGNASGGQDAKLIRKNSDGSFSGFQKSTSMLIPAETPTFESGEAVKVDGLPGAFMSFDGDDARVLLAPRSRALPNGGFIAIEAATCRVSRALLVLENRKV